MFQRDIIVIVAACLLYIYFLSDYNITLFLFVPLHWQFQSSGSKILFLFFNIYMHPHTVVLIYNLPFAGIEIQESGALLQTLLLLWLYWLSVH